MRVGVLAEHRDDRDQFRRVAGEPGRHVGLGGTGLAAGLVGAAADLVAGAAFVVDHAREHLGDGVGGLAADGLAADGRLRSELAVLVVGLLDDGRRDLLAVVVEGGVDGCHFHGVRAHGAQRHGRLVLGPALAVLHAEFQGRLLHVGRLHVHDHLRVDGVHREVGRLLDRHHRIAVVGVVLVLRVERDLAADHHALARAVVEGVRGDRLAVLGVGRVLQGGGEHDRLEGRARLVVGAQGVARGLVLQAHTAVHRDDGTGLRVHGGRAGLDALVLGPALGVLAVELGLQLVLNRLLQRRLLGLVDVENDVPAARGDLGVGDVLLVQLVVGGLDQVALLPLHARAGLGLDGLRESHGLALGLVQLAHLDHVVEDCVEADVDQPPAVRAGGRQVVLAGGLDDGGEVGALLQGELVRVDAVEGLGRGLDAVGVAAVEVGVQVPDEDVVLLHAPVDLEGDHQFPELARRRLVLRQVVVLDVLLGDRRAAGRALAAGRVEQAPGHAHHVDAAVLVEGLVLDGDERGADLGRDLVEAHDLAVHLAGTGHDRTVGVPVGVALERGLIVRVGGFVHREVQDDRRGHDEQDQPEERPEDLLPREEATYAGAFAGAPAAFGALRASARRPPRTALLLRLTRFCSAHRSRSARLPPDVSSES